MSAPPAIVDPSLPLETGAPDTVCACVLVPYGDTVPSLTGTAPVLYPAIIDICPRGGGSKSTQIFSADGGVRTHDLDFTKVLLWTS